jgi:hypothetical protein
MGERQLGFAEAFLDPRMLAAGKLAGLGQVIDWRPVDSLAQALRGSELGRPPYSEAAMPSIGLCRWEIGKGGICSAAVPSRSWESPA